MIVYDQPAFSGEISHDEREHALRFGGVRHLQVPAAANERRLRAEKFDSQVLKIEMSHRVVIGLVALLVAIERRLPTARFSVIGEEGQIRGVPISGHEAFQIATVPGCDLGAEAFSNILLRGPT